VLQLFAAGAFGSDIAAQRAFSCGFLPLSKSYNDRKLVHNVLLSGIAQAVNAGVEPSRDGLTNKNVSLARFEIWTATTA